jgi:hypothetical protein
MVFPPLKNDGGAKTHQLLRCCNCSRSFDVHKYASLLDNRAPCIWRFLLSHLLVCFLAKASRMKRVFIVFRNTDTLFIVFRKKIKTKLLPKSIFIEINIKIRKTGSSLVQFSVKEHVDEYQGAIGK